MDKPGILWYSCPYGSCRCRDLIYSGVSPLSKNARTAERLIVLSCTVLFGNPSVFPTNHAERSNEQEQRLGLSPLEMRMPGTAFSLWQISCIRSAVEGKKVEF